MMIKTPTGNAPNLTQALGLQDFDGHVIAAVGAGGKSSVLKALASELIQSGRRVILSTTTHIHRTENAVLAGDRKAIDAAFKSGGYAVVGYPERDNTKLRGDLRLVESLSSMCDVLLVEADGAKMLPIKAPARHEPVLPGKCDLVLGLAGLSALGKPLSACCHRPELAAEILGCDTHKLVTVEDLVSLLTSSRGQRKECRGRYVCVLGQWDENIPQGERGLSLLHKQKMEAIAVSLR